MKKRVRFGIGILIIGGTIAWFIYYLSKHGYLLTRLAHTPPLTIIWLLLLYTAWFASLSLILQASLQICRRQKALSVRENLLLNAYSSLVNFFVPGQGGPIVRGLYLRQRHHLKLRLYILATLMYYACYAVVSVFLLLVGNRPWWQTILGLLLVGGISIFVLWFYKRRDKTDQKSFDLSFKNLAYLLLATIIQAIFQVAIYVVELHSVNHHIRFWQAITYTGAANFALFVALTPGAIGIRESFLLFSRRLHHISSANIIAASIIDRGVFLVFLAILFIVTISFHTKDRLHMKAVTQAVSDQE